MNKINFTKVTQDIRKTFIERAPEILTGIGIAGMVTTTVLAVKSTPKAVRLIDGELAKRNCDIIREARDNGDDNCSQIDKLPPMDIIKVSWKCYIPATVTGVLSIACLVGASSTNLKRNAALATAYRLSEKALSEYRDAVVETIGEKKEKIVKDNQAKKRMESDPVSSTEVFITEKGNTLCYESISGRYFKSDIEKIKKAQNEINRILLNEMYISLNDFYDEIGLDHTRIGDELGWASDKGLIDIHFSSQIADDGTPCIVIDYDTPPVYGYSSLY